MSVNLTPNNPDCFEMGIANGTWFTLCEGPFVMLTFNRTNDPINVNEETAKIWADLLDKWTPPSGWGMPGEEEEFKADIQEFLRTCEGFSTS